MSENKDLVYKENELLKVISELDNKFTDKINTLNSSLDTLENSFKDFSQKISVNINSILETIVSNKVKIDKLSELDTFKKKAEDTLITHEIRINNTIDEMNKNQFKYDKMFSDNFTVPGFVGQSCQFRNLSEYISYNISEMSKIKSEKNFIKKTCNELKYKVNDTVKTLLNLSESIVMRCNIYTDKKKEELKLILEEEMESKKEEKKNNNIKNSKSENITRVGDKKRTTKVQNKEKESNLVNNNYNELKEEIIKIIDNKLIKYTQKNDFENKLLKNIENSQLLHKNFENQINEINEEIKYIKINFFQNSNSQFYYNQNNYFKRNSLHSSPSPKLFLSNNDNSKKYFPSYLQPKKSKNSKDSINQERIEIDKNVRVKNLTNYNKEQNDKYRESFIKKNSPYQKIKNKINSENLEKAIEFDSSKNFTKSERQRKYFQKIINEENFAEKNNFGVNVNNSKDYSNNMQTIIEMQEQSKKNLFYFNEDSKCDNINSTFKNYTTTDDFAQESFQKNILRSLTNPKILNTNILSDAQLKKRNKITKKKEISDFSSLKGDLKSNIDKTNENDQSYQNKLSDYFTPKISKLHNEENPKYHVVSLKLKKSKNFYEENGACIIANKKLTNKHIIKNNDLPNSFESLFNATISSKKNDKANSFGKTCLNFYKSKLKKPNINSRNVQTGLKKFVTEDGLK